MHNYSVREQDSRLTGYVSQHNGTAVNDGPVNIDLIHVIGYNILIHKDRDSGQFWSTMSVITMRFFHHFTVLSNIPTLLSNEHEPRSSLADIYPKRLSDASMGSPYRSSVPNNPAAAAIQEELSTHNLAEIFSHSHTAWKLQMDEKYNTALREDFYFEQVIFVVFF